MKACLQIKPMYCSSDYNFTSRFNQQYEKSTPNFPLRFEYRISGGLWDALGYHFPINSDVMPPCDWVTCTKPVIPV